jgi:hypothetical protein
MGNSANPTYQSASINWGNGSYSTTEVGEITLHEIAKKLAKKNMTNKLAVLSNDEKQLLLDLADKPG